MGMDINAIKPTNSMAARVELKKKNHHEYPC